MKTTILKNKRFEASDLRLDASYHLSETKQIELKFSNSPYAFTSIKEQAKDVFSGNIFKRVFVSNPKNGVPYVTGSDMIKSDISSGKFISKKQADGLSKLMLKKGWILVSCSGTLGNTVYTNDLYEGKMGTQDLIRIVPNNKEVLSGFLYAYLSSKYGYTLLTQSSYGGVIKHIMPYQIENIPVPIFPPEKQEEINNLIEEAADLRVEANRLLEEAKSKLKNSTNLPDLTVENYDYFGPRSGRNLNCFFKSNKMIDTTTINAFNHSQRISDTIKKVKSSNSCVLLEEVLDNRKLFSTGSFPRIEVKKGIKLINQSDIFDIIIRGKNISRRKVDLDNLTEYGEILIAGVGTLGENETFCRVVYVNEELMSQLVSGEFIRMNTNEKFLSGYLFTWLSTDYGFRFLRSTQTGTKLCRPIQKLLLKIPVPVLEKEIMIDIHEKVVRAHTLRFQANSKENKAIHLIEKEIDSWQQ